MYSGDVYYSAENCVKTPQPIDNANWTNTAKVLGRSLNKGYTQVQLEITAGHSKLVTEIWLILCQTQPTNHHNITLSLTHCTSEGRKELHRGGKPTSN